MIPYLLPEPCAGVQPRLYLRDQAMLQHFASCEGYMPEATLIDSVWRAHGDPSGLFIDVGAHVGTWARTFALAGMLTVAFEPNPDIFACLEADRPMRLAAVPMALGAAEGWHKLTAPGADGGMASIVRKFDNPAIVEDVQVRRLDVTEQKPTLMKIDVEGAELDVIRGGERTIRENRPVILFECWQQELGQRRESLFATVRELDYHLEQITAEMWRAVPQ